MFKIPGNTFRAFGRVFQLGASESLGELLRDPLPTVPLDRILMESRVKQVLYIEQTTPAATQAPTLEWSDVSDWSEVFVNGVVAAEDAQLPQPTDDRIIISIGLHIGGTTAEYTSAQVLRNMGDSASILSEMRAFGALTASHNQPVTIAPNLLPVALSHIEDTVRFREVVSGANSTFNWSIQMLAAEPGVMGPFPGV